MKANSRTSLILSLAAAVFLAVWLLPGCASSPKTQTTGVSVGQQLQDLEKARQAGTINDREYEQLRKGIIKRNK